MGCLLLVAIIYAASAGQWGIVVLALFFGLLLSQNDRN